MKKSYPNNEVRVLLVDAGFSAIPLLTALKDNGYYVGVCGSKKEDPCHQLADESHLIDYSNLASLEAIYTKHEYSRLVAGCTDVSYISCASLAEKLKIPGYDTSEINMKIFNKDGFRRLCHSLTISSPRFVTDKFLASSLRFPILEKPTDSFSGKGIQRFDKKKDFLKHVGKNSPNKDYNTFVYEEYVDGSLYSHSAFIENGEITNDFFVVEYSTVHPYQVNSSHIDTELKISIKNKVRESIVKIVKNCNLVNGLLHTQFISDNSDFWLIEMTRRCPGDLYSLLIKYSTGVNYPKLYIDSFLNKKKISGKKKHSNKNRFFSRHTLSTTTQEIFTGIACNLTCIQNITFNLKKLGDIVNPAPLDRAAVQFLEYKTSKEMKEQTPNLYKKILISK